MDDRVAQALEASSRLAVSDPARRLIGSPGYRLPDMERLRGQELDTRNNILYSNEGHKSFKFDIAPSSSNNLIIIEDGTACSGTILIQGRDNLIVVRGAKRTHNPIKVHVFSDRGVFLFGDNASSNTVTFELSGEGRSIVVGEDCMFSAFIDVLTDDRHAAFDYKTEQHLNPAASVHFAPHVWVGLYATILKGSDVGFGSIIAARTVVTGRVPQLTSFGGVPGRAIRTGVSWIRNKSINPQAVGDVKALYREIYGSEPDLDL